MRKRRLAPVLAALAAVGAAGEARAQEVADATEGEAAAETTGTEYETVVTPQRASGTSFDIDRNVQVIGEERLNRLMPIDIPDALEDVQGVQVQRTNRGAAAPIIRGFIGPQNLILIDGIRFNNSTFRTGPNQYMALIDPYALESVEVLLGPGSVLYGSNAMGGVINARPFSLMKEDGWFTRASARFASADLGREVSATGGGSTGGFSGWIGGSFRDHGELRMGGGDELALSDYTQGDWRARVGYDLGSGFSIGATYLGMIQDGAGRIDQVGRGDIRFYDNSDHFAILEMRFEDKESWLRSARVALNYHYTNEQIRRTTCDTNDDGFANVEDCLSLSDATSKQRRINEDTVHSIGALATAQGWFFDGRLQFTLGSETYMDFVGSTQEDAKRDEDFEYKPKARGNFSDDSTYLSTGGFLYAEGRPLVNDTGELVLSAGARVEHTQASAPDVPDVGDLDYSNTGVVFSGGIRYLLLNRYNFYANFSQGFRTPNLQETTVLGDTGSSFEVPNDELGPEKSNTIETGVRIFAPWVRLTGAFFYTIVDDAIARQNVGESGCPEGGQVDGDGNCTVAEKPAVRRVNSDQATLYGFEFGFNTARVVGFSLFGDLMWMRGEVEPASGEAYAATRMPPLQGTLGIRYDNPSDTWGVEIYGLFATAQDRLSPEDKKDLRICESSTTPGDLRQNCSSFDGWFTMGLRGHYSFDFGLDVVASVDNLLDQNYRVLGSGFDAPGINARVGLNYRY